MAALSIATVKRGDDLKQTVRGGQFGSSSIGTFMHQVLFRWGEERVRHVRCIGDHNLFYIG